MSTVSPLVFSCAEAAELLQVSLASVYAAAKRGEIPSFTLGRRVLIPKAALLEKLAAPDPAQDHQ